MISSEATAADRRLKPFGMASADTDPDRFAVAAHTTRFWKPGDRVFPGECLGIAVDSDTLVRARDGGRVSLIEYDVDREEVILIVEPAGGD